MSTLIGSHGLISSRVLLTVPVALGMVSVLSGPAQAASATGPVHAEVRADNWVDNAVAPSMTSNADAVMAAVLGIRHVGQKKDHSAVRWGAAPDHSELLKLTAAAAVDVLRFMVGSSGSTADPQTANR